jgi:hypothetical protein
MSKPNVGLNVGDLSKESFVVPVSPVWPAQTAITVCNPDGSNIIGGATIDVSALSGDLTNNNAAPSDTNIGVLPAVANASVQTWSEGNQVLLSVDLSGSLRTLLTAALPAGTNVIGHVIVDSGSITANAGTNLNTSALALETGGNLATVATNTSIAGPTTATRTSVNGANTSTTILALNTNRQQAVFYNDSTAILYLDLSGGTASNSAYSVQIASQGYFELPAGRNGTVYTGLITGIWASANGSVKVTEITA